MMTITAGSGDKNTYPLDNNSIIRDHMTSEQISNEFNGIRDCELLELIQYFPKDAEEFLLRLRGSQGNNLTTGLSNGQHQRQKNAEIKTHKFLSTHDVEAPFSALTTYRNTFCHLTSDNINNSNYHTNKSSSREISQPILRFGDMPVFTDSILYPGQSRRLLSTTHETFVEKPVSFIDY
ncbi:unnamed protein product [Trichobilharzia regenti]|nr:unnamed protein product [Trichobilharzia regenti]